MVTGLMIIKSLISFFSGLVGGADALKEGDDIKGDLGKTLATSAKVAVGVGSFAARANPLANMAGRGAATLVNKGRAGWNKFKAGRARSKAGWSSDVDANAAAETAANDFAAASAANAVLEKNAFKDIGTGTGYDLTYQKGIAKAKMAGITDEDELDAAGKKAIQDELERNNHTYATNKSIIDLQGFRNQNEMEAYQSFAERTERVKKIRHAGYMDEETGKLGWKGLTQSMANTFRNAGGTLAKALMEGLLPALKIDPGKILDITRAGSNKKYDKDGNLVGQYWTTKEYSTKPENREGMFKQLRHVKANAQAVGKAIGKTLIAPLYGVAKGVQAIGTGLASAGSNKKVEVKQSSDAQNIQSQKNQERLLREILKEVRK